MERITFVLIVVLIAITVAIVIPYSRKENSSNTTTYIKYCRVNEDCVPATCCHPTDCVNIANKPDCKGIMCTMECSSILDCGQGHCACVNNECKAIIG